MKVRVDIGSLVLDGVSVMPHERPMLKAAVERELARSFAERGTESMTRASTSDRSRSVGPVGIRPDLGPERMGERIAAAVYRSLRR